MTTLLAPFRYAYDFAQRHKKKIIGLGVCTTVVGGYVAYSKVKHFVPMIKQFYQQTQSERKLAAQKLLNFRFEHNFQVAQVTLSDFAVRLRKQLDATFNIPELQKKLKLSQQGHDLETWQEFRVQAMTKTLSVLYSLCFVNVLIKIQLSIVSRYMFHDAQQKSKQTAGMDERARTDNTFNDFQARLLDNSNKQFFGLSEYAQKEGLTRLTCRLKEAVSHVLSESTLKSNCSLEDIQVLFTKIQQRFEEISSVDGDDKKTATYSEYLFPSDEEMEKKLNTAEQQMNHRLEIELEDLDKKGQPTTSALEEKKLEQVRERRKQIARVLNAHATKRLREMTYETMSLIKSSSFKWLITNSIQEEFAITFELLQCGWSELVPKPGTNPPLTKVIVRISKMFSQLLPEDTRLSPILNVANSLPSVKELCAFIYYPMTLKNSMEAIDISRRMKSYDQIQQEPVVSLPLTPVPPLFGTGLDSGGSLDQREQLFLQAMEAQFAQVSAVQNSSENLQ